MISGASSRSILSTTELLFSGLLALSFLAAGGRLSMGELPATDEGVCKEVEAGEDPAMAVLVVEAVILPEEPVREGAGPGFLVKKPLSVDCFLVNQPESLEWTE